LFGQDVSDQIASDQANTGFVLLSKPEIATANPLISKILRNVGTYVHRSYHKYQTKGFGSNIDMAREFLGPEVFDAAVDKLREMLTSSRIRQVEMRYRPEEKSYVVQFYNEYGIATTEKVMSRADVMQYAKSNKGVIEDKQLRAAMNKARQGKVGRSRVNTRHQTMIKFGIDDTILNEHLGRIMEANSQSTTTLSTTFKSLDTEVLKKRRDISEELRILMGEIMDPVHNYTNTVFHMTQHLETHKALVDMMDDSANASVSAKKTGYHTKQIAKEDLPFWNFENNGEVFVTPELYEALGLNDKGRANNLLAAASIALTAYAKMATTVFFQGSQNRNFIGAIINLFATGTFNLKDIPEALAIASQGMLTSDSKVGKAAEKAALYMSTPIFLLSIIYNKSIGDRGGRGKFSREHLKESHYKLLKYGLVEQDIEAGQLNDMLDLLAERQGKGSNLTSYLQQGTKIRKAMDAFSDVYQLSDNLFKAVQFMKEVRYLQKAYGDSKSLEQIEEEAADIVRRTQPTYSRLPEAFRLISMNPFFGTFINFKAAMYQTRWNILSIAQEEINSGNTVKVKRGYTRLASNLATMLSQKSLKAASMALYGWSDEEDEALSDLGPFYYENNDRVYLSSPSATPSYIDFSYVNPTADFDKPINSLMRGKGIGGFFKELAGPLISQEIFAKAFLEATVSGRDEFGRELYGDDDSFLEKSVGGFYHTIQSLTPKVLMEYKDILGSAGIYFEPSEYAETYSNRSLQQNLANTFIGAKSNQVDIYMGAKYKIRNEIDLMKDLEVELRFDGPSGLVMRNIKELTGWDNVSLIGHAEKYEEKWQNIFTLINHLKVLDPQAEEKIFDKKWLYGEVPHYTSKISQEEAESFRLETYPGLEQYFNWTEKEHLVREYESKHRNDPRANMLLFGRPYVD